MFYVNTIKLTQVQFYLSFFLTAVFVVFKLINFLYMVFITNTRMTLVSSTLHIQRHECFVHFILLDL